MSKFSLYFYQTLSKQTTGIHYRPLSTYTRLHRKSFAAPLLTIVVMPNVDSWNIVLTDQYRTSYTVILFFFLSFFVPGVGFPLYPEIFYIITQWSCSASGSLWEMPDSNPRHLPQKCGALPMSHHISKYYYFYSWTLDIILEPQFVRKVLLLFVHCTVRLDKDGRFSAASQATGICEWAESYTSETGSLFGNPKFPVRLI